MTKQTIGWGDGAGTERDRERHAEAADVDRALDGLGDRQSDDPARDELTRAHESPAEAALPTGCDPSAHDEAATTSSR